VQVGDEKSIYNCNWVLKVRENLVDIGVDGIRWEGTQTARCLATIVGGHTTR
jgi:hypothetical protein